MYVCQVSHENEENCNYLIAYGREEGEEFLEVLQNLFRLLDEEVRTGLNHRTKSSNI